jgi:ubiquinone/menaquinone biosynthesis C-methylase UbiE
MKVKLKEGQAFVDYWERTVPWTFKNEKLSYRERRRLRYALQDYMLEAIPFSSYNGKLVLEIGSGSGIDSAEFARHGASVVSLDFTEAGTKSTMNTFSEAGVSSFDVVRAAAQRLPFRDGVFDCVYSFGVLHHIPDVGRVTKEISRKLAKRGELICMLYNKDSLLYAYSILFLHRAAGLSEDEMVSKYSERVEGCPYTKAYTRPDVLDLLADDFYGVSTTVHYNVIDTLKKRKVKTQLSNEYQLGWHIIARARKRMKPVRKFQRTMNSKLDNTLIRATHRKQGRVKVGKMARPAAYEDC